MKKSLDRCIMRSFSSLPLAFRPRLILNDEDISRICDYLCLDFGDFKIRHKHELSYMEKTGKCLFVTSQGQCKLTECLPSVCEECKKGNDLKIT